MTRLEPKSLTPGSCLGCRRDVLERHRFAIGLLHPLKQYPQDLPVAFLIRADEFCTGEPMAFHRKLNFVFCRPA